MYIVGGRYYPLAISTQACQVVGDDISVKYLALQYIRNIIGQLQPSTNACQIGNCNISLKYLTLLAPAVDRYYQYPSMSGSEWWDFDKLINTFGSVLAFAHKNWAIRSKKLMS